METNHIINPDDQIGKLIGFTANKFDGWLWRIDDQIYISFIVSKKKKKGNLSKLFNAIADQGWTIKVPSPLGKMEKILKKKNFVLAREKAEHGEMINVWMKKPDDTEKKG